MEPVTITKLGGYGNGDYSLYATVPKILIRKLSLRKGDFLQWKEDDGRLYCYKCK